MKIKLLAAMAISAVLAVPSAFAADEAPIADTVQAPSVNTGSMPTPGNEGNVGAMNNNSQSPSQLSENGATSPDEMTADAASGEDDF